MNSSNLSQISKDDLNLVFIPLSLADIKHLERMFSFWIKAFDIPSDRDVALRSLFVYILHNVEQFKVYTGDSKV